MKIGTACGYFPQLAVFSETDARIIRRPTEKFGHAPDRCQFMRAGPIASYGEDVSVRG